MRTNTENSSKRTKAVKRNFEEDDALVTEDVWGEANAHMEKLQISNKKYVKDNKSKQIIINELDNANDKAYAHIKDITDENAKLKQKMQNNKSRGYTTKNMISKTIHGGNADIKNMEETDLTKAEEEKAINIAKELYMSKMKKYNICIGANTITSTNDYITSK